MRILLTMTTTAFLSALSWRGRTTCVAAAASRFGPSRRGAASALAFVGDRRVNNVGRKPFVAAILSVDRRGASAFTTAAEVEGEEERRPIPIVLLAGFLGSGKTSTLKHLLENNVNVRIGTIVNDVAAVNIDAKLVSNVLGNIINDNGGDGDGENNNYADGGVVELQNGCACCSLADELLTSVVRLTDGGKRDLDAIVVELSGVADPMAVRDNWEQARLVRKEGRGVLNKNQFACGRPSLV